jgi:DNA-3-methyladenine glycosylase II
MTTASLHPHQRVIRTLSDVNEGVAYLRDVCPYMRRAHDLAGDPPLRRERGGFEGLVQIVVGQQLSIASASAIWARLEAGLEPLSPDAILKSDDVQLASLGLSRPKIKTLRAMSAAANSGALPFDRFAKMPDTEVRDCLIAVSGIGPWTSDIYLMFCLGRSDQFAPGDLALQIAAQSLMKRKQRPSAEELSVIAARRWRPWRGVAARMLWTYYAFEKGRGK